MQVPILNGSYTDENCNIRSAYPINYMPIFDRSGISEYYIRPTPGLIKDGEGPGVDRGGINWNGICYRVMGTKLCKINADNSYTELGDVGGYGQCSLAYGFDRLAIASSGKLYYWNGTTLTQVTDVDLGYVVDMLWVDSYYMTTDGDYLVVTDLNDPTAVNPLKYGSSEADPDPIKGIVKLKNEVVAFNRYTIEFFDNIVTTALFPFQRMENAQIQRGCVGTHACCIFAEAVAFLGSGRNESPAVWIGVNSTSSKLSTNEIDEILKQYSESVLSNVLLETKYDKLQNLLLVHLPDKTLVYDAAASLFAKEPVWFILRSTLDGRGQYKAKNLVWCYDKWLVGDPTSNIYGHLTYSASEHYGEKIGWEFSTPIVYNKGRGVIVNAIELIALTGRTKLNNDPTISTCYSNDGLSWSQEKFIKSGKVGESNKRLFWVQQGKFSNWRIQKFKGNSDSFMSFVRLEVEFEALYV